MPITSAPLCERAANSALENGGDPVHAADRLNMVACMRMLSSNTVCPSWLLASRSRSGTGSTGSRRQLGADKPSVRRACCPVAMLGAQIAVLPEERQQGLALVRVSYAVERALLTALRAAPTASPACR
jgi:hypothetical protein